MTPADAPSPTTPADDAKSVRRQARGRARIESILDAAEQLVAEVGYDEMATNELARRAGISPGSLYQFFRNKDDVLAGLLDRYTRQFDAMWDDRIGPAAVQLPLDEAVDLVMEAVVSFKSERPAFWAIFHGSATTAPLAEAGRCLEDQLAARLAETYAERAPHLSPERCELVAKVSVATVRGLLPLAVDKARRDDAPVLAEAKRAVVVYLDSTLTPPS